MQRIWGWLAVLTLVSTAVGAVPRVHHLDIEIREVGRWSDAMRIAKDPRDQTLYVMDQNARIGRLDPVAGEIEVLYRSAGSRGEGHYLGVCHWARRLCVYLDS